MPAISIVSVFPNRPTLHHPFSARSLQREWKRPPPRAIAIGGARIDHDSSITNPHKSNRPADHGGADQWRDSGGRRLLPAESAAGPAGHGRALRGYCPGRFKGPAGRLWWGRGCLLPLLPIGRGRLLPVESAMAIDRGTDALGDCTGRPIMAGPRLLTLGIGRGQARDKARSSKGSAIRR